MKRIAIILCLLLLATASYARVGLLQFAKTGGGGSYTGPGDIVSGATAWWGLRAYSAAKRGNPAINVCNVSDVACADMSTHATTGALVVTTIGGSDCGVVVCTIKTAYDQTGNGNNLTQATISSRPVLTPNCIGALPCMTLNGSRSLSISGFNGASNLAQPYTISAAVKDTGSSTVTAGGVIVSLDGIGGHSGVYSNDGSTNLIETYSGTVLTSAAANNSYHAFQSVHNGASSNINVDGTDHTGNSGTRVLFNIGVTFGNDTPTAGFVGTMLEGGVWPTGFSSGNASAMSSNQHTYWGF